MHRFIGGLWDTVWDQISPRAWALVLIAVAVTAATFGSRWLLVQRALHRRQRVCQLLPTDTFDPRPEEIVRFAATVLSRVHRVTRAVGAQRACAVRIGLRLVDGDLAYVIEGPDRARSLLRQAGYREVEAITAPAAGVDGDELVDGSDLAATPPQPAAGDDPTLVDDLTLVDSVDGGEG